MASTAGALFVHNDADDIGWWIAYHLAIGFDALLIYDDGSTDGTWEIIQAASGLFPIEAHRLSSTGTTLPERRSDAFTMAIASCASRFDWVICLESDEYVYPQDDDRIGVYLDRFPKAEGISLNWSVFGANNHVTRTREAPIAAYTRRAPLNFPEHRLCRTFIRPEAFRGHFIDTCHWMLDSERHVFGNGIPFEPNTPACWEGARILHYVSRNMTHYTRRSARLTAAHRSSDLWSHFNRNDEEDLAPLRFLDATRHTAAHIARAHLDMLYWRIREEIKAHSLDFLPDTVFAIRERDSTLPAQTLSFSTLHSQDGKRVVYDSIHHRLMLTDAPSDQNVGTSLWLVTEETEHDSTGTHPAPRGFLFLPETPSHPIASSKILTSWLPVIIQPAEGTKENAGIHLLSPLTAHGLGVDCDEKTLNPECTTPLLLFPEAATPNRDVMTVMRPYLALRSHGNRLRDFYLGIDLLPAPQADALACAIAHLDPDARLALETCFPGSVPVWLMAS